MPYGAHETMEMHEILMEKINTITHFNLYAQETNNPHILDMIGRHTQEAIASYNELVSYTRRGGEFQPITSHTDIANVGHHQIQYGLHNPQQFAPQAGAKLSDREICGAMLLTHKNGARNAMMASLECADPNLRMMLTNSAAACANQAYEVFLYMNEQGLYQVPTLNSHTAQKFLHSYQPADQSMQQPYASYMEAMNPGGVPAGATMAGGNPQGGGYGMGTGGGSQYGGGASGYGNYPQ